MYDVRNGIWFVTVGGRCQVASKSWPSRGRWNIRERSAGDEENLPGIQRSSSQHARQLRLAANRLAPPIRSRICLRPKCGIEGNVYRHFHCLSVDWSVCNDIISKKKQSYLELIEFLSFRLKSPIHAPKISCLGFNPKSAGGYIVPSSHCWVTSHCPLGLLNRKPYLG